MNDRELLYIKTIAEMGSVSAAARELFVSQPSLSQTLLRIEEQLGCRLFSRTAGGLKATDAGRRYVVMANRVLKAYEDFRVELEEREALQGGRIVFGVTPLLGSILLPKVLPAFRRSYPKVSLDVVEENSRELDRDLTACEISFAIMHRYDGALGGHLDYETFDEDPFVVTVGPESGLLDRAAERDGYPFPVVDVVDLASEPLVTVRARQRIRQVTDAIFVRAGVAPAVSLEVTSFLTAQNLAAQGMGYTLGPQSYSALSRCDSLYGARFLSLDRELRPLWLNCIATYRNASLSAADLELKGRFARVLRDAALG